MIPRRNYREISGRKLKGFPGEIPEKMKEFLEKFLDDFLKEFWGFLGNI